MLLSLVVGFAAFTAPMGRMVQPSQGVVTSRARTPVAIGGFKMPEIPNPFGGDGDFQLYPSDVDFTDVDGDYVVLRKTVGGKIDFYVNKKIKLEGARMAANGNMLEITGSVKQGFSFLGPLGFALEDIVTEGVTPTSPDDLAKAMALVE